MLENWDTYKELAESDEYEDTNSSTRSLPEFVIPQNQWLSAEATYKQQAAVVAQAQTALNNAALSLKEVSPTIYAPIAGSVTGLGLQVGSVISPKTDSTSGSDKIATITTVATPTISINLTEMDVTKVEIGDKATITVDALGEMTFTGSVVSIDTAGTTSSGVTSYPAVIKLDTAVQNLYANMSVTANIITETKHDVVLVPSSAITTQNGVSTVRLMKDGSPVSTEIAIGLTSDSQTEITSGISEGAVLMTGSTATTATKANATGTSSVFSGIGSGAGLRMR
jgi:multidrug efflux pump subunit AcrA (membrane-fusion protein)